jgi:SAM-dependent methyltransferase
MLARTRLRLARERLVGQVTLVEGDAVTFAASQRCGLALFTLNTFSHLLRPPEQLAALMNVRRHLLPGGRVLIDQWNPHASTAPDSSGQWVLGYRRQDARGRWVTQSVSSVADPAEKLLHTTLAYDVEAPRGRAPRQRPASARKESRGPAAVALRRTVVTLHLRYFYRFEVEWLLLASGYELEVVFGTYDLDLYTTGAPRLIWLARNPAQHA